MAVAPLCIIQMRYASTRLPGKMLLTLGGETLAARAWRIACEAFGSQNVVIATPFLTAASPLGREIERIGAIWHSWWGLESDVLGRFHETAHWQRHSPADVIVRYTPDDPFKTPAALRCVAEGERLPVELGGEAFTLAQLDRAHATVTDPHQREHITYALGLSAPACPAGCWTIDTLADYEAACALVELHAADATGVPS